MKPLRVAVFVLIALLLTRVGAGATEASGGNPEHAVIEYLIAFAVVLIAAKLGGEAMERLNQPAVLGELLVGLLMGNATLLGIRWFEGIQTTTALQITAEVGVVLLLFEVGMDTHLKDLMEVGASALTAATLGVIAPMALGYFVSALFLSASPWYVHLFAGATLAATSVGITARVFKDLGKTQTREARIILGAAVVDDVLGLIVLAVVTGIVASIAARGEATLSLLPILWIVVKAVLFFALAIGIGQRLHLRAARLGSRFKTAGMATVIPVVTCFLFAALAGMIGLAPIVGSFAAGLILEPDAYEWHRERQGVSVHQLIQPLTNIFVPVFFVLMGYRVHLETLFRPPVLAFAGLLTLAAIAGKQACGLGVLDRGVNRWIVGVGMIPRGEVGLIFTGIGAATVVAGKPVFGVDAVSALVVMVMLTTVMTPPLLKSLFKRQAAAAAG